MRVIFLDIDGVLNAQDDFGGRSKPNPNVGGLWGISIAKVKRLKYIVDRTDAKLVLTSTWKKDYNKYINDHVNIFGKYLYNKLRKCDLRIFDTTERYETNPSDRSNGIKGWLKDHEGDVESYIILDDDYFPGYDDKEVNPYLVFTSICTGLTPIKARECICKLLNLDEDALDTPFEKIVKTMIKGIMPTVGEEDFYEAI